MEVLHAILIILMILSWTLWVHASRKKYRQLINPISLYTTIWLVPACFSITGFYNLFIPSPLTLLLVLINVWVFDLSCFCIKHREKGFSGEKQRKSNEDQLNTKRKRYTLLIISNCVCLLWLVPYIRAMLPYIVSGNWAYARSLYLLASTNHTVYTVSSSLFLQWIILPLFYTTALVSAYYVAKQKPNYILLIITVVDVAAIVMATAGRNVIMKVLGQFAARIFRVGQKTLEKNNEFWKCLMVFMFFVIFFSEWEYELIFPYTFFAVLYTYLFFYKKSIVFGRSRN